MQVSFVVPLFNCLPLTQAMVASLQRTIPAGLEHEIILVDDGSTDGTRAWLDGLSSPFRTVLNARNLGFAGANNRGAALARGEYLFLLNNDLVLTPGWIVKDTDEFRPRLRCGNGTMSIIKQDEGLCLCHAKTNGIGCSGTDDCGCSAAHGLSNRIPGISAPSEKSKRCSIDHRLRRAARPIDRPRE